MVLILTVPFLMAAPFSRLFLGQLQVIQKQHWLVTSDYVSAFKVYLKRQLEHGDVYLVFDKYNDFRYWTGYF